MFDFSNKIVIITGAKGCIGSKVAQMFVEFKAQVFCGDIAYEPRSNLRICTNERFYELFVDVTSSQSVEVFFKVIHDQAGPPDVVVNAAGLLAVQDVLEVGDSEWEKIMDVNLKGTYFASKTALKYMIKNRCGNIVNLASVSGKTGSTLSAPQYSASKAGVISLTRTLARLAAPHGVRVNSVAPGGVEGEMVDLYRKAYPALVEKELKGHPLGRFAEAEEIAFPILFLASDMASYITGECLNINGGALMD